MARHRIGNAEEAQAIPSRFLYHRSVEETSIGGRATPPSGPASNPGVFGRAGAVSQGRSRGHPQREPLPFAGAALGPPVGRAADGSGDGGEAYELGDFGGSVVGDDEYSEDEEDEEDAHGAAGGGGDESERRLSDSTVASFQLYTPDEEQAVVQKLDRRLVIFLAFCYMLSFVDRSNIGNARIAGMEADLQSSPLREDYFEWALRAFYIAYIAFEWMSLLWRIVPAHIYVSLIVLSWGVVASLQAVVTSYPQLIALRVLLGIGEAGFTGVPFYLSFFFKRHELAFRTALFISAAPLASAFAGFVAWLILWAGEIVPIASWRLLFLLEGFPSVIVATVAWGVIPDSPETAPYLSPRERKIAVMRLRREKAEQHDHAQASAASSSSPRSKKSEPSSSSTPKLRLSEVLAALGDPKAWLAAFMLFLANMAYSTLPAFLPTILRDMGHSALEAEVLSAPPHLVAFGVVLATARLSDWARSRAPFIAAHALLSASGYLVLALAARGGGRWISPAARYAAVYPAAAGFFSVVVLVIAWSVNNQPAEGRRGAGFALLQLVGQFGPLLAARLYPDRDAPFFETGMWACAAAMLGVAVLAGVLRTYLAWLNRRMDREQGAHADAEGGVEEEIQGLVGSGRAERTGFRYIL